MVHAALTAATEGVIEGGVYIYTAYYTAAGTTSDSQALKGPCCGHGCLHPSLTVSARQQKPSRLHGCAACCELACRAGAGRALLTAKKHIKPHTVCAASRCHHSSLEGWSAGVARSQMSGVESTTASHSMGVDECGCCTLDGPIEQTADCTTLHYAAYVERALRVPGCNMDLVQPG